MDRTSRRHDVGWKSAAHSTIGRWLGVVIGFQRSVEKRTPSTIEQVSRNEGLMHRKVDGMTVRIIFPTGA